MIFWSGVWKIKIMKAEIAVLRLEGKTQTKT